jgi:hypothetical protein
LSVRRPRTHTIAQCLKTSLRESGMVSEVYSGENGRLVFARDGAMSVLTFLQVLHLPAGDFYV